MNLNQAYQLFIDEVPERLQEIENGLLNLRDNITTSQVHGMMRSAHSIKGGSASVGLKGIKDIAHKLEDYIKALYNQDLVIDTELENLFLAGYDCLALPLREQLETGNFDRQEAQNRANKVWEKLELKLGNVLKQVENYLPSSEDLGIDIIASIFEVDVAQEIRRLKGLIASPESFDPPQELQESLDILIGFSELVNLSGFALLTNITQQALQKHPSKAVTIAKLFIQDLDKSRDSVLLGDRIQGGNPCSALLTLAEDTSAEVELNLIEQLTENYQVTFSIEDPSYQFFIAEIPDLLHNLESGLLTIKEDKSISKVNDMMRAAHSIKGGAASIGLEGIKNISHRLEDYLKALFDESVIVDEELETYLLEGFDCLKNALHEQIETGNYRTEWEENASIIWDKLGQKLGHIQVNNYLPSSADLGIDLVQSLFDVEVLQIIEHLKESLNNSPIVELQEDVTLQLEMLVGFGEITNLIGLKIIAETVSLAIKNYPHRIQQITSYLIQDLTEARQEVLSGDREQGGKPSTILQELAGILDISNSKESTLDFSDLVQEFEHHEVIDTETLLEEKPFTAFESFHEPMDTPSENSQIWAENIEFSDLISNEGNFDINNVLEPVMPESSEISSTSENFNRTLHNNSEDHLSENAQIWAENIDFGDLIGENDNFDLNDDFDVDNEENQENFLTFASLAEDYHQNSPISDSLEDFSPDLGDLGDFASFAQDSSENSANAKQLGEISSEFGDLDTFMDNFTFEDENNNSEDDTVLTQQQELQAQSYIFYMEEAVDLIALIDNGLENALETRDINEVNEVARAAHSLKGGARSAGLEDLGNIALRVEKSLKALFNENIPLDNDTKAYIRQIYQLLRQPLIARFEEQNFDEKFALDSVNELWAEFEGKYGEEIAKSEEFLPSSSDLGIDIATSIFEVDVVEGINNLKSALSEGNEAELQDLISMQIDVFSGFGEMLVLPGFIAICETTAKALENHPSQITVITQAFIDNLEIAQKLVIEGDRDSGGEPSIGLLTLAGEFITENPSEVLVIKHTEAPIDTTDQSYSFFVEEAPELLEIIENGLLTLREERSTPKVHEIMRAAHSLKGGSASVGLEGIKIISHQLEDVFKVLYDSTIELDTELEGWLLEGFDCLRNALTMQIETGSYNPQEALITANEIWTKINGRLGAALSRVNDYIPSSTDLGVDIVQSMFEVDVQEELQRLKDVIKNPDSQPLAGELRATLEVFSGFGEMLVLPGFAEIAQLGLIAIEKNPRHAFKIIQLIIRDADNARDLVLNGDRTTGGTPSTELRRFADNYINYDDEENYLLDTEEDDNFENQPSLMDVFGESQFITDEIFSITNEDRETQTNNPSLEDVFNFNIEDDQIEAIHQAMLEDDDDNIPNLEDIFDSEFSEEEIKLLAKASELALEEDKNNTIPSVSEVFSNMDISVIEEENNQVEEDNSLSSLSEVFSNVDMSMIDDMEEEDNQEGEDYSVLPSLSQVFSNVDMSKIMAMEEKEDNQTEEIEDSQEEEEEDYSLSSLSEVFSNVDMSMIDDMEEEDSQEGEDYSVLPSLSQVFSNVDMSKIMAMEEKEDNQTEEIEDSQEEEEEDNSLSSLSEVFSNVDMSMIDDMEEEDSQEGEDYSVLPSLSQVFSNVDMSKIMAMEEKEDNQVIEEEEDNSLSSLTEVFSNVDMSMIDDMEEEDSQEGEDYSVLPSLSQVFSNVDMSMINGIEEDSQNDNDENSFLPSLSEVFSNVDISAIIAAAEDEEENTYSLESVFPLQSLPLEKETEEIQISSSTISENLDEVIKSIGDVYQKLPGLKTPEEINSNFSRKVKKTPEKSTLDAKATITSTSAGKTNLTVRVDLERLERMNNLIGELSINRNGLSLQNDKLQTSVKELLGRFISFQQMANNLRDLSDKMVASPDKFRARNGKHNQPSNLPFSVSENNEFSLTSSFDALEMDSYDNMYYITQGLIEQMIQLEEAVDDIALFAEQSGQTVENQRQMLNRLRDELMWARMLPLGEVLNRFPRVLRDLSVKYNKKVNLKLNGTSVLVDKAALEKLYDPLVHLIRNGFDHGIEIPEIRKQRGKSETGIIEVKAYHQGNQTIIEIRDDGGGLNLNKIGQKAIERQMLTPEQLAVTTKDNLLDLIFEPGFSTAASVTEISGRGVGLDIVRSQLRSLKGSISVDSEPGLGTTFILRLPLTLTIDKLLVLSAENHFYALPSDNIEEIIVPEKHQLKTSGNKRFLHYENRVVPIYPMIELLEYRCYVADNLNTSLALEVLPTPDDWANPLLLMRLGQELFAIEVDSLLSEQELVIKPFGSALTAPSYTYGCTILGDGTLIPVINTAILLANFLEATQPKASLRRNNFGSVKVAHHDSTPTNIFQAASVLVIDDSAAMRRTLALSLEKSGYRVLQAKDGKDAIEQLQISSNVNLIICDIEMPNMNGFEFLGQRRRYPELNRIPVAMLTSRSNDKHRKLATHLGANAYFTKPYIEQKFLQSIKALVEPKSSVSV